MELDFFVWRKIVALTYGPEARIQFHPPGSVSGSLSYTADLQNADKHWVIMSGSETAVIAEVMRRMLDE